MKTAVEWLLDNLKGQLNIEEATEVINQAKEMEKEQIVNAFKEGVEIPYIELSFFYAKHYYELTYGDNK